MKPASFFIKIGSCFYSLFNVFSLMYLIYALSNPENIKFITFFYNIFSIYIFFCSLVFIYRKQILINNMLTMCITIYMVSNVLLILINPVLCYLHKPTIFLLVNLAVMILSFSLLALSSKLLPFKNEAVNTNKEIIINNILMLIFSALFGVLISSENNTFALIAICCVMIFVFFILNYYKYKVVETHNIATFKRAVIYDTSIVGLSALMILLLNLIPLDFFTCVQLPILVLMLVPALYTNNKIIKEAI